MRRKLARIAAGTGAVAALLGTLLVTSPGYALGGPSADKVLGDYKARYSSCPANGQPSNLKMLSRDDGIHVPYAEKDVFVLPAYPGAELVASRACEPVPWSALAEATWTSNESVDTVKDWYLHRPGSRPAPTAIGGFSPWENGGIAPPPGDVEISVGPSENRNSVHVERPQSGGPTIITVHEQYGCDMC